MIKFKHFPFFYNFPPSLVDHVFKLNWIDGTVVWTGWKSGKSVEEFFLRFCTRRLLPGNWWTRCSICVSLFDPEPVEILQFLKVKQNFILQ